MPALMATCVFVCYAVLLFKTLHILDQTHLYTCTNISIHVQRLPRLGIDISMAIIFYALLHFSLVHFIFLPISNKEILKMRD